MSETSNTSNNVQITTLGDICLILSNSGKHISYGKEQGKYPFYNSSLNLDTYVDSYDYNDESIIISKYGTAKIKYDVKFSCSPSVYVLRSNKVLIKYIYYYLYNNLDILQNCYVCNTIPYITKQSILSIKIPIPSIETQHHIINLCQSDEIFINQLYNDIENIKQFSKRNFTDLSLFALEELDPITTLEELDQITNKYLKTLKDEQELITLQELEQTNDKYIPKEDGRIIDLNVQPEVS